MKSIRYQVHVYSQIQCYVLAFLLLDFTSQAFSQTGGEESNQEIQSDSTVIEEEEASDKLELRMSFEAFKINQELKLMARVRSKAGAKFQNTPGVEVSFYVGEVIPENFIGKDTSDHKGETYWMVFPDSILSTTYVAAVVNHSDWQDVEETATVNPSRMEMNLEEEDSLRLVKIFVGHPDESGQIVPLVEVECNIYVKRLFGILPVGESETTDEYGNITLEFPRDIQGNESGDLTIIGKISGHEILGNVEVSKTISWGIPSNVSDFYQQRELWSARSNAPIALIVIVNVILLGIWSVIIFIFLEIFRINKLGKINKT